MSAEIDARVKWYRDRAERRVRETVFARVSDGGNLARRTMRKALGQPAPRVQTYRLVVGPDGRRRRTDEVLYVFGAAAPGDPLFKRSGRTVALFGMPPRGWKVSKGRGSEIARVELGGDLHGWEAGSSPAAPGVRRPISPVWDANRDVIQGVLAGKFAAPQYGDLSAVAGRRAVTRPMTLAQAAAQGGELFARRTAYSGPFVRYRRARAVRPYRPGKRA
jgi:hypothetical protein